jgi:hypothetical protein
VMFTLTDLGSMERGMGLVSQNPHPKFRKMREI